MKIPLPALMSVVLLNLPFGTWAASVNETDVYAGWIKPGPPPVERFVKPLGLSAEQYEKLKPIFAEAQLQAAADNEPDKASPPSVEASPANQAIGEADLRTRLATVLTAQQLATYDALTAAHLANAPKEHSHPTHGHSDMNSATPPDQEREPASSPR